MSKTDGVDVSYWESLLSKLKAQMAKARLRDRHQINLRQKLELLKNAPLEETETKNTQDHLESSSSSSTEKPGPNTDLKEETSTHDDDEDVDEKSNESNDPSHLNTCLALYEDGNYSPPYVPFEELKEDVKVISSIEAEENIENLRKSLIETNFEDNSLSREEILLHQEARKGMTDDEVVFSVETKLEPQVYLWSDKYRPRKPRYFNRVHTGFEWNKYNQTHYDMDNPPPKIVQGYKFNIFYPDLINQSCTPQYFLTPCSDNADFSVLKFHAGPPYEDIAFKIVNREWEFSYKRGFRCQFQNNIFQLWFHFKRYRYRR